MSDKFVNHANAEELMQGIADALAKKEDNVFKGSTAQWEALTDEEKAAFRVVIISDGTTGTAVVQVVNVIESGNPNAVTSGAVADIISPVSVTPSYESDIGLSVLTVTKSGHLVIVDVSVSVMGVTTLTKDINSTGLKIGTVPAGYRPSSIKTGTLTAQNPTTLNSTAAVRVHTDGSVIVNAATDENAVYAWGQVIYAAD